MARISTNLSLLTSMKALHCFAGLQCARQYRVPLPFHSFLLLTSIIIKHSVYHTFTVTILSRRMLKLDFLHNHELHTIHHHKFRAQNAFRSSSFCFILYRTSAKATHTSQSSTQQSTFPRKMLYYSPYSYGSHVWDDLYDRSK
jgi:hypothetical protein